MAHLTLTSVVFEYTVTQEDVSNFIFNFNKCCIWIEICDYTTKEYINLTLTSVVFE